MNWKIIPRTLFFIAAIACCSFGLQAQDVHSYSLQQCIDYALQHQTDLKSARLDRDIAIARNKEVTGLALPQISANGSFTDNIVIQKQLIDASNFSDTIPKGTLIPFEFGLQYNALGTVTLTQTIFDGSVLVALQAKKTLEELARKNVQRTERDVKVAVSKAYYNALISRQQMELVKSNIERLQRLLHETSVMYKNGFAEKLDIDRINVQLNNLNSDSVKLANTVTLSDQLLKFQMGMPLNEQVTLSDSLRFDDVQHILLDTADFNYDQRIEYSLMQTQERVNEYDLKRYKMAYLPTLSFNGAIGTNRASNSFDYFDAHQFWYGYGYVGLNLSIPLFDGFQRKHRVDQAKMSLEKSQVALDGLKQSIDLEQQQSGSTLRSNLIALQAQQANMKLAEDVYNTTRKKYEQGVGSNIEVINAQSDLKQAQTNYFGALYDAIIAKIDYQKAVGQL